MKAKARSIHQIVEDQAQKWNRLQSEKAAPKPGIPVITVSREPGSGGKLIAKGIAEALGLDLFHQEVIHEMAQSARVETRLLETLDEKGLSVLEDWITSLVRERHLWQPGHVIRQALRRGKLLRLSHVKPLAHQPDLKGVPAAALEQPESPDHHIRTLVVQGRATRFHGKLPGEAGRRKDAQGGVSGRGLRLDSRQIRHRDGEAVRAVDAEVRQ